MNLFSINSKLKLLILKKITKIFYNKYFQFIKYKLFIKFEKNFNNKGSELFRRN